MNECSYLELQLKGVTLLCIPGCFFRACLVPVFSFGENDLFVQANNAQGSYLRSFQEACKRTIRFTPPLLQTFRLLPNQRPVSTVGEWSSLVQWGSFSWHWGASRQWFSYLRTL